MAVKPQTLVRFKVTVLSFAGEDGYFMFVSVIKRLDTTNAITVRILSITFFIPQHLLSDACM